ncbi:MAG: fructose-bisphosphatase class III [Erysipelotrichaceae bacterium]|nr:fructose-bisphosphatase class III [Erysipelotrichaceae bacterium]
MIYIMSDIHGQYKRYKAMMEKIELKSEDKLYILGDVIDRGPQSLEILSDIMDRENVELFLGNHEHMMLTYLNGTDTISWFYAQNGGRITYEKYLLLSREDQKKIVNYLSQKTTVVRYLNINDHHYTLSHTSAPTDGNDLFTRDFDDLMDIQDIVWNVGYDSTNYIVYKEETDIPVTFISGHIISRRFTLSNDDVFIQKYPNGYTWMDIDCGCAMGENFGQLSCLKIDDTGEIIDIMYVS